LNLSTTKLLEPKEKTPQNDTIKPKPNTAPDTNQRQNEDTLTEEDIIEMLGLKK